MKRLILALFLSLAMLGTVAPTLTGCKTTPQKAVFNTLWSMEVSVDKSFRSYLDLVVAGKLPTSGVRAISTDYEVFQAAMRTAIMAVQGNTNAVAPQYVADAAAKVINAVVTAEGTKK